MALSDDGGTLQAVVGTFRLGDTITAPIVGTPTTLPRPSALLWAGKSWNWILGRIHDASGYADERT